MSPLGTQSRGISGKNVWSKHRINKQSGGTNETQRKKSTCSPLNENGRGTVNASCKNGPHVLAVPHFIKSEEQISCNEKENDYQTTPKPFNGNLRCRIPVRTSKFSTKNEIETRPTKRRSQGNGVRGALGLALTVRKSALAWLESARDTITARRHRQRVLLKEIVRDWRMVAEEEKREWRLGIRATAKYRSGLLRLTWEGWRTLLTLAKDKMRKREQQERIATVARIYRTFRVWRSHLDRRRTERERATRADCARRKFHLARAFGNWRAAFSVWKYWTELDDTAHQMYLQKQRRKTFDLWYFRYLELSALREREDRLRSRHWKQILQVVMTAWLDYVDCRKLKLEQIQVASLVYATNATRAIWQRWRYRQIKQHEGHEKSIKAEHFHGFCVLKGALLKWQKEFRSSIYNRKLVQSSIITRTKFLKHCFFRGLKSLIEQRNTADEWNKKKRNILMYNKWHDTAMARIAAREKEAMRPGQAIYNGKLIRMCWAAWDKRTTELKRDADIYKEACKHRRRNELLKAFNILKAYQSLKSAYRKESAVALRFGRRRQLMRTWDVWQRCLTDRAITSRCVQKAREFYLFQVQRKCLLALRTNVCTSLVMQKKKDVAVAHYKVKVIVSAIRRWQMYSSMRAQELHSLQLSIEKSLLSILRKHWRHWIELCKARYVKRRKLFISEITYRRTMVHRCLYQWKHTAAISAERRRCERGFIGILERRKLRNRLELWKSEWRRLQYANELLKEKETEKYRMEQGKYFTVWLNVLRTKQGERRKEDDRLDVVCGCMVESKMRRHFRAWILQRREEARRNALFNALRLVRKKKILHSVIVKWVNEARIKIWHQESAHEAVRFRNRFIVRMYFLKWWNLRPSYKALYHHTHAQPVLYWSYRTLRKSLGAWHRWAAEFAATRELLRKAEERRRRRVTRDACMAWIGGSGSKYQEKERKWEAETRRILVFDGLKSGSILMEANVKRLRGARRCGIRWRAEVLARKIEKERKLPEAAVSLMATRIECKANYLDATYKTPRGQTLAPRWDSDTSDRPQPRFPHAILDAPLFEIPIRTQIALNDTNFIPPASQPVTLSGKIQKCQKDIVQNHAIKALRPTPRLPGFYMDESFILRKTG